MNRHVFSSINVQIVVGADSKILHLVAKWFGSVHDSRMLRERDLHMILLTNDTGDFFLATVATFQAVFVDAIRSSDNPAQIQ